MRLVLSPLAFPRNPYHRLVKDYKLVRESLNDPVADARLAARLFVDEVAAFRAMDPALSGFHAWCLGQGRLPGGAPGALSGAGMAGVLCAIGARPPKDAGQALERWQRLAEGRACRAAIRPVAREWLGDPARLPGLAYGLAWLWVSSGDSVLPPWVRRSLPGMGDLMRRLRDTPCADDACAYCREHHDAAALLERSFGFAAYRPEPRASDGGSLQRAIVEAGLRSEPLLAILPTGAGKSLCFQVPALARHARSGELTVVISPLQALMRDQVENLERRTRTSAAAALYGMLSPPERAEVLERLRLGSIGLLYISPEQLRNRSTVRAILGRQVGCWVFDEAHCLSKWGHDFRPDYLYAVRFIGKRAPACVACYTATARLEVIAEVRAIMRRELGQELRLFEGGMARSNLTYSVQAAREADKEGALLEVLAAHLDPADRGASAIVYCRSRGRARDFADVLTGAGWTADHFHAGRTARHKAGVLEGFVRGDIQVVSATNAFGMGIDKASVRLVVHVDLPGSLESYLQECGRAGRDSGPAHCALLYDAEDADARFRLSALSELGRKDITQVLRAIRRAAGRLGGPEVVATSGELLAEEGILFGHGEDGIADAFSDSRVKTAVAWLERAGLVERAENDTAVRSGRPRVSSLAEARQRIDALGLPEAEARRCTAVLRRLIEAAADPDEEQALSVDTLSALEAIRGGSAHPGAATERALRVLNRLEAAGLVDAGAPLSALVKPIGLRRAFDALAAMERGIVELLRQAAPDAAEGEPLAAGLRDLTQRLRQQDHAGATPATVRRLLRTLDQGERSELGWLVRLRVQPIGRQHFRLHPYGPWSELSESLERRHAVSGRVLDRLIAGAGRGGRRASVPSHLEDSV